MSATVCTTACDPLGHRPNVPSAHDSRSDTTRSDLRGSRPALRRARGPLCERDAEAHGACRSRPARPGSRPASRPAVEGQRAWTPCSSGAALDETGSRRSENLTSRTQPHRERSLDATGLVPAVADRQRSLIAPLDGARAPLPTTHYSLRSSHPTAACSDFRAIADSAGNPAGGASSVPPAEDAGGGEVPRPPHHPSPAVAVAELGGR